MRRRPVQGFTLVELLLVIAVLGILAVLGAGGVRGFLDRARLADATSTVASQVKDARRLAKTSDDAVTLVLETATDGSTVLTVAGEPRAFPAGVGLGSGSRIELTFDAPFGSRTGSDVIIPLTVGGRVDRTVVVTGILGRVVLP